MPISESPGHTELENRFVSRTEERVDAERYAKMSAADKATYIHARHMIHMAHADAYIHMEHQRLTRAGMPMEEQVVWMIDKEDPFVTPAMKVHIEKSNPKAKWLILGQPLDISQNMAARPVEMGGVPTNVWDALRASLEGPAVKGSLRVVVMHMGYVTTTEISINTDPTTGAAAVNPQP